jgi:hypothetical protein
MWMLCCLNVIEAPAIMSRGWLCHSNKYLLLTNSLCAKIYICFRTVYTESATRFHNSERLLEASQRFYLEHWARSRAIYYSLGFIVNLVVILLLCWLFILKNLLRQCNIHVTIINPRLYSEILSTTLMLEPKQIVEVNGIMRVFGVPFILHNKEGVIVIFNGFQLTVGYEAGVYAIKPSLCLWVLLAYNCHSLLCIVWSGSRYLYKRAV